MSIISGSYDAWWGHSDIFTPNVNALNLGNTATGYRQTHSRAGRQINFDALGEVPADEIYTGVAMTVDFVLQEPDAPAVEQLIWRSYTGANETAPFLPTGATRNAGGSLWARARPLVLFSCNRTEPCMILYYKTILQADFDVDTTFSHIERTHAFRLLVFPVSCDIPPSGSGTTVDYYPKFPDNPNRPAGCNNLIYFRSFSCAEVDAILN